MEKFLSVINESYIALERDKELAERAFAISEEEYIDLNKKLKHEVAVKKLSVEKLKEAVGTITGDPKFNNSDDLLMIARQLNDQVNKRKNAEKVFTSLITNMQSGVLLEDENRLIVFTNQLFCDIFGIPVRPEDLQGADCSNSAEQAKHLFKDPDAFASTIETLLREKKLVTAEILELADGRIFQRDYIPIFIGNEYKGHLWSYTDISERKKIQSALEESELKNRLIMNASLDAIITINKKGIITFWNPQAEKIFGWKEEEIVGRRLSETIIPVKYREMHEKGMKHYAKTGEGPVLNKQIEIVAINSQGNEFPIELSIVPVKQGDTEFFCSFIRDISARKKNEEALKASEELWQFALEGAGDGVWEYDFETKDVFFSKQYKKMLGFEEVEFRHESSEWYNRIHPDDAIIINQTDLDYAEKKITNHQREYRIKHKNGDYVWILDRGMIITYTEDGKPKRMIGTHSDITERKLSEQAIKINEEKYRSIIANMKLGMIEVDNDEIIQFANQSFCNMSGFEISELMGKKASRLFVKDEDVELINKQNIQRRKGISGAYEISVKNKAGEAKWWLVSGAPRYNDKGELVGSIGIHLDITEQKNLEVELIEARHQAESSATAKQAFLTNMSHEIRTPMNAILGMARQLQKSSLNEQQQFFLQTINDASENLLVIINDILDISKIEAGKLSLETIGFSVRDVVNKAIQVTRHRAEEKGLKLVGTTEESIANVFLGDPFRLTQVLLNLLSNAVKFSNKGRIQIAITLAGQEEEKQLVQISVTDTGIGMEKEFIANLFQSFSQEDRSVSRKYGGTGLGMAISKQLVEMMGGTIQVESKKNIGSRFSLIIPFTIGKQNDLPEKEIKNSDSTLLKGKKILLVEDNEMNRLVATVTLGHYGAVITEAFNGVEAVETMRKFEYDLVLMDMQMPVMDGLAATRIIRKELESTVPIIALTANAIKGENEKCLAAGMNDYVSKPFAEEDLVNMIAKWLGQDLLRTAAKTQSLEDKLYNLSKLHEISRGDQSFVKKMINMFCNSVPPSVTEIKTAYEQKDYVKIKSVAHRIKPSIDSMGIESLKNEIRQIEQFALQEEDTGHLCKLIEKLETVVQQVVLALKSEH
jgi:PAS domain S-box-containing protein